MFSKSRPIFRAATRHSQLPKIRTPVARRTFSAPPSQAFIYSKRFLIAFTAVNSAIALAVIALTPKLWDVDLKPSQHRSQDSSTVSVEDMSEISYDTSDANMTAAVTEFEALLGQERISRDLADRIAHSSTAWSAAPRGDLDRPAVIVHPRTTEEVSAIAKICHQRRIPMIGFSGGTSLEGTLAATCGGVCIDFKLMDKVVSLNKDDVDIVVQPGVDYMQLNTMLAKENLFFPPDPGPGAKIGGMISQGCSGTNAFRYGTVKDWVLGLTIVLADGTIVKTRGRPRKSSSGYNLTQLMVGSEGTLGLVTEASLKLTSLPENEQVGVAQFPSINAAVATAVKVVQSGMPVGAMELLDEVKMKAVNEGGYCEKSYDEKPTLFFKFSGHTPKVVGDQIQRVRQIANDTGRSQSFEVSTTEDEAASIWEARKTVLFSFLALKTDPSQDFLSSDTAVPIGRLGEAIEASKKAAAECGLTCGFVGHVGDGNFHTGILYSPEEKEKARAVITTIQRKAIELDGTITGEHGIGLEYRDMAVEELGPNGIDMMRQIKLALDPRCLLNPDKVFRMKIKSST